eukprot:NODE_18204_length_905_cov_2.235219.p2 GENE.NODE_18204_length_905_cov_2.235219~~NODE_18204_length_905_cov_2.235219.p2  ORF type:complete len:120 (-),score=30.51 NODE_18204_length_905_cov_2.235219:259-618(-)
MIAFLLGAAQHFLLAHILLTTDSARELSQGSLEGAAAAKCRGYILDYAPMLVFAIPIGAQLLTSQRQRPNSGMTGPPVRLLLQSGMTGSLTVLQWAVLVTYMVLHATLAFDFWHLNQRH